MIAAIRIRGEVDKSKRVKDTFARLRLRKKHVCVLLPENPETIGMLKRVKDFITYGNIDRETLKLLVEKRARLPGNKPAKVNDEFIEQLFNGKKKLSDGKLKPFFRLNPPRGGFGKGGIKVSFKAGGVLGNCGKEINVLIKKML